MPQTSHKKSTLKSGYTTGASAAAAARGAANMLSAQHLVDKSTIILPNGEIVTFDLHGQSFTQTSATCFVIKDAGDDPDITNGAEIHATAVLSKSYKPDENSTDNFMANTLTISGGVGIGKATKPGLAVAPGEWAINPVPRQMITDSLSDYLPKYGTLAITISIPDGEQRAKKTLNERLGIIGGLSILGTTGIVRPISAKAWTDTIDTALNVALACGCENVLLSTGRTSELAAQTYLKPSPLDEACIMMGDYIGYALNSCMSHGYRKPIIACQFAKFFKIACGYQNTNAAASELDLKNFASWVKSAGYSSKFVTLIQSANTAREIIIESNFDNKLLEIVSSHALQAASIHAPGITPRFLLADYGGKIVFSS